jgi:integrase
VVPGVQVVRTVARSTWTPGAASARLCLGRRWTGWAPRARHYGPAVGDGAPSMPGRWLDPAEGRTTVRDWSARWLAAVAPQLKHKTQATYRSLINSRINPALDDRELSSLRPITITEWVAAMRTEGLSASRIRQAYRVLSQIMASAVDNDLIPQTPCRGVRLPRMPQTEPHIVTPQEASGSVRAAEKPHDLLIALLAFAGLRVGEAFALRRSDVDVASGFLLVDENLTEANGTLVFDTPKSHQKRLLRLAPFLAKRLRA